MSWFLNWLSFFALYSIINPSIKLEVSNDIWVSNTFYFKIKLNLKWKFYLKYLKPKSELYLKLTPKWIKWWLEVGHLIAKPIPNSLIPKFKLIEKSITGSKNSKDPNEMIKATFLLVKNMRLQIKHLIHENNSKDENINHLSREVVELKIQVTDIECENCKNSVIINGLSTHPDAKEGKESQQINLLNSLRIWSITWTVGI